MQKFISSVKRFAAAEEGVTMIEYGLLAALISVVCIGAITIVGTQLNILFTLIGTKLQGANA